MRRSGNFEQWPEICRVTKVYFCVANAWFIVRMHSVGDVFVLEFRVLILRWHRRRGGRFFRRLQWLRIPCIISITLLRVWVCVWMRCPGWDIFGARAQIRFSARRQVNAFCDRINLPLAISHPRVSISNAPTNALFGVSCLVTLLCIVGWRLAVSHVHKPQTWGRVARAVDFLRGEQCVIANWRGNRFQLSSLSSTRFPMSAQTWHFPRSIDMHYACEKIRTHHGWWGTISLVVLIFQHFK